MQIHTDASTPTTTHTRTLTQKNTSDEDNHPSSYANLVVLCIRVYQWGENRDLVIACGMKLLGEALQQLARGDILQPLVFPPSLQFARDLMNGFKWGWLLCICENMQAGGQRLRDEKKKISDTVLKFPFESLLVVHFVVFEGKKIFG